nr:MinD/ParA family protein [Mycobacterium sp. ACS1612]
MATHEWPEEDSQVVRRELDDIDSRAARLMAQMASRRARRPVAEPPAEPDEAIHTDEQSEFEYPRAADDELSFEAVDLDPSESVVADSTGTEADESIIPETPQRDDDAISETRGRHRSTRRMATPPWQSAGTSMSRPVHASPDFVERLNDADSGDDGEESEAGTEQAPGPAASARPGWPAGMQPPPVGWQAPQPGWPPMMPPPPMPPGWQGPPPWMPPPPGQGWPGLSPRRMPQPGAEYGPREAGDALAGGRHSVHQPGAQPYPPPDDFSMPEMFEEPSSLDDAEILSRDHYVPKSGWRRFVHRATGGRLNPGVSRKEGDFQDLLEQIRQPIVGDFRIAVLSIKGGVGKTTTTLGLGSALAMVRADRVIAIDANPDRGTLAERVADTSTMSTVRDLLRDPSIRRYADVRHHTRLATSRLEVLASEQDPAVAEIFGEEDYRRTVEILRSYYNVILTDCGTGIMHSAMAGVLDLAHAIVLVSSPAIDAARSASATLDWLDQHDHADLVREAHVVLSESHPSSATVKLDKVYEHFETRCGSIHVIPFEPHLAEGADFDFSLLRPATLQAFLDLAGAVSEKFSRLRAPTDPH